jgi:hypothetical protein
MVILRSSHSSREVTTTILVNKRKGENSKRAIQDSYRPDRHRRSSSETGDDSSQSRLAKSEHKDPVPKKEEAERRERERVCKACGWVGAKSEYRSVMVEKLVRTLG